MAQKIKELNAEEMAVSEFIKNVRADWAKSGKSLVGTIGLKDGVKTNIRQAVEAGYVSDSDNKILVTKSHVMSLTQGFEEMCRRLGKVSDKREFQTENLHITGEIRSISIKFLSQELVDNVKAAELAPEMLINLTLYHGAIVPKLREKYEELEKFGFCLKENPTYPERGLQNEAIKQAFHSFGKLFAAAVRKSSAIEENEFKRAEVQKMLERHNVALALQS